MSTDYFIVCKTCKLVGPIFASGSMFYGYKVWDLSDEKKQWFGHREAIGKHEGHELVIVHEDNWIVDEWYENKPDSEDKP